MSKSILKLSYKCNNCCYFCHGRFKNKTCNSHELITKIESIKDKTDCIILSGGEPTIDENFFQIAKFVKKNNLGVGMVTNARTASNHKLFETIKNFGISPIYTTFHSNEKKEYDKITRTPDSFEQAVEGIKNLLKIDNNLLVNIVLLNDNFQKIDEIISYLDELGVCNIKLSFVEPLTKEDIYHTPNITEASKSIKKAIDSFPHKNIGWDGLPLCAMKTYEEKIKNLKSFNIHYVSEAFEKKFHKTDCGNKTKFKECSKCKRNNECEGIYSFYSKYKEFIIKPYQGLHH